MKKIISFVLSFLFFAGLPVNQSFACTTFCLKSKSEILFGKNYDYHIGDGLVIINKRGVQKMSVVTADQGNPLKWTSKYGSVTFNQYGRENPNGGMNETGLVVELMWLEETQYPKADSRPTVDTLEWIQYQLDTAATVEEVLKSTEGLRIASVMTDVKIHYLINDKTGNTATVEFLDGKLVARTNDKLSIPALSNETYDKSLEYFRTAALEKARTDSSFDRFTRAAVKVGQFEKKPKIEQEAVKYAFDLLAEVAQSATGHTKWSIVYDQKRGKIYFRTLNSPAIKSLNAKSFDYSCGAAVKIFDINSKESGDVTAKFSDYTRKANRDLIDRAFSATDGLKDIPRLYRHIAASYPERFICEAQTKKPE